LARILATFAALIGDMWNMLLDLSHLAEIVLEVILEPAPWMVFRYRASQRLLYLM